MKYNEVNWDRLNDRHSRWWKGELADPLLIIQCWPTDIATEPRPATHEAVKRWFMDPAIRMQREMTLATHSHYFGDGYPTIDIGRINIGQAAFYGCPTNFTQHTIWVEPVLDDWAGWQDKIQFDENNELWQLTVKQAKLAVEIARGEVAITQLGGSDGPLDNLSTVRGSERALWDVMECPDRVLELERRFLADFQRYYFTLYDLIKNNRRGVGLWSRILMTDGPAHSQQSDFSCMISPDLYRRLGQWYLREQAKLFKNIHYHLDGSNAVQHLPMLYEMPEVDCIQYIYQVPEGKSLTDVIPTLKEILAAGKRAEVYVHDINTIAPVLEQVPHKGLKLNIFVGGQQAGEDVVARIRSLGLAVES